MKKIIQLLIFLLSGSGIFLIQYIFPKPISFILYLHIILGFGFTTVFILFTVDHLKENKKLLKTLHKKSITGWIQLVLCSIIILSGIILYLYASVPVFPWSQIHLWVTIPFLLSCLTHFGFILKRKKTPSKEKH
ncbi:MAG: hypothetical protein ACI86H_000748 [bacterium]